MGGRSSEHGISLASARSVVAALDPARYDVVTVEIGHDGRWALGEGATKELGSSAAETLPVPSAGGAVTKALAGVEVVLPILHGPFGEDGTVQGMLELADVPYVGAGVTASAVCMDKDLFKAVMRDQGVPVTRNITLRNGAAPENPFGYPVFVKPARLGSSVGITKAHDEEELRAAVELAFRHDEKVLVEEFVSGVEVEVGVLGNREPVRVARRRDRRHEQRVVRLRGEVRRGRDGPRGPRPHHRRSRRARPGARRAGVRRHRVRGHGPCRLLRDGGGRRARERAEHDPRLHGYERVREALRGLGDRVPRAARPAHRARPRAPRAPLAARLYSSRA